MAKHLRTNAIPDDTNITELDRLMKISKAVHVNTSENEIEQDNFGLSQPQLSLPNAFISGFERDVAEDKTSKRITFMPEVIKTDSDPASETHNFPQSPEVGQKKPQDQDSLSDGEIYSDNEQAPEMAQSISCNNIIADEASGGVQTTAHGTGFVLGDPGIDHSLNISMELTGMSQHGYRGYDVSFSDEYGDTALYVACIHGNLQLAEDLISQGANVNTGKNPLLCVAAWRGNLEVAKWLLQKGADVTSPDQYGDTALYHAARQGHIRVAELLIAHGANVNQESNPALCGATKGGKLEMVKWLLENGADVTAQDQYNHTALDIARSEGDDAVVSMLTESGSKTTATAPEVIAQPSLSLEPDQVLNLGPFESRQDDSDDGIYHGNGNRKQYVYSEFVKLNPQEQMLKRQQMLFKDQQKDVQDMVKRLDFEHNVVKDELVKIGQSSDGSSHTVHQVDKLIQQRRLIQSHQGKIHDGLKMLRQKQATFKKELEQFGNLPKGTHHDNEALKEHNAVFIQHHIILKEALETLQHHKTMLISDMQASEKFK